MNLLSKLMSKPIYYHVTKKKLNIFKSIRGNIGIFYKVLSLLSTRNLSNDGYDRYLRVTFHNTLGYSSRKAVLIATW